MNKIETQAWIRGTDWQLSEGSREWIPDERRKGISQSTYMHDPWTQTTVWWGPEGRGDGGWVEVGKGAENGDVYNSVSDKNKVKNKIKLKVINSNQNVQYFYMPYSKQLPFKDNVLTTDRKIKLKIQWHGTLTPSGLRW